MSEIQRAIDSTINRIYYITENSKNGTPSHCVKAEKQEEIQKVILSVLEKQIPKKPTLGKEFYWTDSVKHRGRYINVRKKSFTNECPSCKKAVAKLTNTYCHNCGQAIDWSEHHES